MQQNNAVKKIALGTAQFGSGYGIANKNGKIPQGEVSKILEYAHEKGIDMLDTAHSYGESQSLIGEFTKKSGKRFNLVSKTPVFGKSDEDIDLKKTFTDTLKNLSQNEIYAYLIHGYETFLLCGSDLWKQMQLLKKKKLVKKIGISLYTTEELDNILKSNLRFEIVQVPYNIFDRRFEKYFSILKKRKVEVHARSVFLQGLFFINTKDLNGNLRMAEGALKKLDNFESVSSIPKAAICLCFALTNPKVDRVIIGVDNVGQLEYNLRLLSYMDKMRLIRNNLEFLRFHEDEVILPYKWTR